MGVLRAPDSGVGSLFPLRRWWLVVLAFGLQLIASRVLGTNEEYRVLKIGLLVFSYALLLLALWANRERWGVRILGVGITLNLIAMLANGGLMPVSPVAREASGRQAAAPVDEVGSLVPYSKDVLLHPEQTNLYPLTDVIIVGSPVNKAISPGDVIMLAGFLVTMVEAGVRSRM